MTIEEIAHTLPNGFHDSDLIRVEIDYAEGRGAFIFDIDLSDLENQSGETRRGKLVLDNLLYIAIEPPCMHEGDKQCCVTEKQWIQDDSSDFGQLKDCPKLPEPMVEGAFRHWFYLSDENNFIYVAAKDASFSWVEE